jgi:hypothetical protein
MAVIGFYLLHGDGVMARESKLLLMTESGQAEINLIREYGYIFSYQLELPN